MCIICVKLPGIEDPTDDTYERCFKANPDGAGMAYLEDSQVRIRKGYKTFEEWKAVYDEVRAAAGSTWKEQFFLAHFRIGTHGSKDNPAHTHPFPVANDYKTMEALDIKVPIAMAHNGMYSLTGLVGSTRTYTATDATKDEPKELDPSDSMEFAKKVLFPLVQTESFLDDTGLFELVDYLNGSNRLIVMDGRKHKAYLLGTWNKAADGMCYSNAGYIKYEPPAKTSSYYDDDYSWSSKSRLINTGGYKRDQNFDFYKTHYWDKEAGAYLLRQEKDKPIETEFKRLVSKRERQLRDELRGLAGGFDEIYRRELRTWYEKATVLYVPRKEPDAKVTLYVTNPSDPYYIDCKSPAILYYLDAETDQLLELGTVLKWWYDLPPKKTPQNQALRGRT